MGTLLQASLDTFLRQTTPRSRLVASSEGDYPHAEFNCFTASG